MLLVLDAMPSLHHPSITTNFSCLPPFAAPSSLEGKHSHLPFSLSPGSSLSSSPCLASCHMAKSEHFHSSAVLPFFFFIPFMQLSILLFSFYFFFFKGAVRSRLREFCQTAPHNLFVWNVHELYLEKTKHCFLWKDFD